MHLWFIHGFAESGEIFSDLCDQPVLNSYTLFMPDLPGFGHRAQGDHPQNIVGATRTLSNWINEESGENPIVLIGHSVGGLIATELSKMISCKALVSVEGNITSEDCFYSGQFAKAQNPSEMKKKLHKELLDKSAYDPALARYAGCLNKAVPATLKEWGISAVDATGECTGGENYAKLNVPSIYFYGTKSIPAKSLSFLESKNLRRVEFQNSGHWPMINEPEKFATELVRFLHVLD